MSAVLHFKNYNDLHDRIGERIKNTHKQKPLTQSLSEKGHQSE